MTDDVSYELLPFPQERDERGTLTYIEQSTHVPFDIRRVYYLYEFTGIKRGEHAHKSLEQVLVPVNGSLDVQLDNGTTRTTVTLDDPTTGLYVPPATWRVMDEFAQETVCLVLASAPYDESDYIRDYQEFLEWRAKRE